MRTRLLVLACGARTGVGVDLRTGRLLRTTWVDPVDPSAEPPEPYDVVEIDAAADERLPFAHDEVVARVRRPAGRITGRRAERLLRPLEYPVTQPLLGATTAQVPYWTVRDDQPSVALLSPSAGPVVERDASYALRCRFRWRRLDHDLPLHDATADERLAHPTTATTGRLAPGTLVRALGWRPHRLVVELCEPREGVCDKVVRAILPKP